MIIVFEGADGVGKSSVIEKLKEDEFFKNNNNFVFTKEPADNDDYSKLIRKNILENENDSFSDFLFFMGTRVRHFKKYIIPNIDKKHFIFDRYYYSTFFYQSEVGNENIDRLFYLSQIIFKEMCIRHGSTPKLNTILFHKIVSPKLIFYFHCDLTTQLARQIKKKDEIYKFEKKLVSEKQVINARYQFFFSTIIHENLKMDESLKKQFKNSSYGVPGIVPKIVSINTTLKTIEEIKNICLKEIKEALKNINDPK